MVAEPVVVPPRDDMAFMNDSYGTSGLGAPPSNQAPRYLPVETTSVRLLGDSVTPERPVFGIIANLSDTGACIIANSKVAADAPVTLSIETGPRRASVKVSARVIWCAERVEPIKEIAGYLTGLRFEDAADEAICGLIESGIFRPEP